MSGKKHSAGDSALVGIDIGGTFADVVVYDADNDRLSIAKSSTTSEAPARCFFNGLQQGLDAGDAALEPTKVRQLLHGSTIATNAVLERRGASIGLLVTEGFGNLLEIGRAAVPAGVWNAMQYIRPAPLVPLERIREVPERLDASGQVVRPLDEAGARAAIEELAAQDIDCLAIVLLHSYANSQHEKRLEAIAREVAPTMLVSCSSDVLPAYREYERAITTILNAYLMPVTHSYLSELESGLGRSADGSALCRDSIGWRRYACGYGSSAPGTPGVVWSRLAA